jgi:F-type H+-transporting ATPase subunit a
MTTEHPTRGRVANLFEALLHFVRDKIAKPSIGHDADKFVPLLWTIFFFFIICNLMGLVPWLGTITSALGATFALAVGVLLTTFFAGFRAFGPKWLWSGFVPHMDLPVYLQPLKLMIYAIEVLGMFIKHAVLAVRLLANMAAGHLVLLAILGMIVSAAEAKSETFGLTAGIALVGATLLTVLEFGVALLQAYVFTLLSALFIGSAAHEH